MTETSQTVGALAAALAKAQAEIEGASKDRVNPHFKASYATLASVWEACRGALAKNGLAVVQSPVSEGAAVTVFTTVMHASGEWMRSALTASARDGTPQSIGSAITYLRRYALAAMVGVAPEDDDGNEAQPPRFDQAPPRQQPPAARPPAAPAAPAPALPDFNALNDRLHKVRGYGGDENKNARKTWWAKALGYVNPGPQWSPFTPYGQADVGAKRRVLQLLEQLEAPAPAVDPRDAHAPPDREDEIPF